MSGLEPFWGLAPCCGQKRMSRRNVGLETSPWTFSSILTPIYLSNFFLCATFLMCILTVATFACYNYCSFRAFWYVWKVLSNQTKTLLLGETAIQFYLKCNDVSIIRQVFPSTIWNQSGWGGRLSCSSHKVGVKVNSEENGFVDKPIDLRVVAASPSSFSNSASLEV